MDAVFFYFDTLLIHSTAAADCSQHLCNKEKNNLGQNMQKKQGFKNLDCVGLHNSVHMSCIGHS